MTKSTPDTRMTKSTPDTRVAKSKNVSFSEDEDSLKSDLLRDISLGVMTAPGFGRVHDDPELADSVFTELISNNDDYQKVSTKHVYSGLLAPQRCFTCGDMLGDKRILMKEWLEEGGDLESFYNFMSIPTELRPDLVDWLAAGNDPVLNQAYTSFIQAFTGETGWQEFLTSFWALSSGIFADLERGVSTPEVDNFIQTRFEGVAINSAEMTKTRENLFLAWDQGDPLVRHMLTGVIRELDMRGVLVTIFNNIGVPFASDQHIWLSRFLVNGTDIFGFIRFNGIPFMGECCRMNLRPAKNPYSTD
jgi:hypothetical protein